MAFASKGTINRAASTTPNQASAALGVWSTAAAVGDLAVIVVAVDNNQTTDGDEGAVTSVTDSGGNVYSKAIEFCNGQGSAQAGATCSIWYSDITTAISAGTGSTTINFSNNASRDASAITGWLFTKAAGQTVAIAATNTLANDAGAPGSLNATTANIACLRIRGLASETNSVVAYTGTALWTQFNSVAANSGTDTTSMTVHAEFHISTGTSDASAPTWVVTEDHASAYVAFNETPAATGWAQLLSDRRNRLVVSP